MDNNMEMVLREMMDNMLLYREDFDHHLIQSNEKIFTNEEDEGNPSNGEEEVREISSHTDSTDQPYTAAHGDADGFYYCKRDNIELNHVESPKNGKRAVKYGPWGGNNGGVMFDDGVLSGVREIYLSRSDCVVSIRVCYDINGRVVWGGKNGGYGGFRFDQIKLNYPSEYLTGISGYYGPNVFRGPTVVKSLSFFTNKTKYGPFGDEEGIAFWSGNKKGHIVGFHGREGLFLESIGVYFVEKKSPFLPLPPIFRKHKPIPIPKRVFGPRPLPGPCRVGPWGGSGGIPWDDGFHSGINKIFLTKGLDSIWTIQIEYDSDNNSIWSMEHGHKNEATCHVKIKFDYPQQVLTCLSGYWGSVGGNEGNKAVKSLTFHTNRGIYGPFGVETGTYFTSGNTQTKKIVGFHGNSGRYLYAIGVYTQNCSNDRVDSGLVETIPKPLGINGRRWNFY